MEDASEMIPCYQEASKRRGKKMKKESSSWDYASAHGIHRKEHVSHLVCEKYRPGKHANHKTANFLLL